MADRKLGKRLIPLYERVRSPKAHFSGKPVAVPSVGMLGHAKYLLLETERLNGTTVATPMWFAIIGDTIVLRTEADSPKAKRIRNQPIVRAVPAPFEACR